uniref:CCHC-type domain-containing protein n=1 Tax=Anopheles dirus TaxID=7168 RepID=A0A182NCC5_9DIPT
MDKSVSAYIKTEDEVVLTSQTTTIKRSDNTGDPIQEWRSAASTPAKCALLKLRPTEGPAAPPLDIILASTAARPDHLPRIELPKFNGSPSKWPTFAGRLEKCVASLTEDADRIAFLLKCRCDIARYSCEAFENAGMPFQQTWKKLEERFYKKRVAFLGHFQQMLELPKLTTVSANGLMRIIDVVETSIASARQIAGEQGQKPTVIEDGLLVSRGDLTCNASLRGRSCGTSLTSWLIKFTTNRRRRTVHAPTPASHPPDQHGRCSLPRTVRPAVSKPAVISQSPATGTSAAIGLRRCYACDNSGHVGTLCPELRARSAVERIHFVMGKGKFINCLSKQHAAADCPSEKRCQTCSIKDHTLLHIFSDMSPKSKRRETIYVCIYVLSGGGKPIDVSLHFGATSIRLPTWASEDNLLGLRPQLRLWEANIKVTKRLFKSTAKGTQLNLVELQTLMHQISAILQAITYGATIIKTEDRKG